MNQFKLLTYALVRTYATVRKKELVGIRQKVKLWSKIEKAEATVDEIDEEDLAQYESDFLELEKSHRGYEREEQFMKEKLKRDITKSKYFKEVDPSFLTFTEKFQIKEMHENNPEEWTIERLSESFPALPRHIKRILKSNWSPKTVDSVIKYDMKVIENWRQFRAGRLALHPDFTQHLMKFKDRKISLASRDILAKKLIPPKFEFPKPKSTLYTNIVQGYIKEKLDSVSEKNLRDSRNQIKFISSAEKENRRQEDESQSKDAAHLSPRSSQTICKEKFMTFDQFAKQKLEEIYKESPEEGVVLQEAYRKHLAASDAEKKSSDISLIAEEENCVIKEENVEESVGHQPTAKQTSLTVMGDTEETSNMLVKNYVKHSSVDTYIKCWKKKMDNECSYASAIKIPKDVCLRK
ncbi:hypothetical protein KM043_008945 [Ampulex compressa]|nr:hypothetical protein KM043_008945 [Ampulex compressa]